MIYSFSPHVTILVHSSVICFMPNIYPPFSLPVKSQNWSTNRNRRSRNMGQRSVGVCGRCQFASTSPVLSAALFASKGSNIHGPMPCIQTSTTFLSSSTSSVSLGIEVQGELLSGSSFQTSPCLLLRSQVPLNVTVSTTMTIFHAETFSDLHGQGRP